MTEKNKRRRKKEKERKSKENRGLAHNFNLIRAHYTTPISVRSTQSLHFQMTI